MGDRNDLFTQRMKRFVMLICNPVLALGIDNELLTSRAEIAQRGSRRSKLEPHLKATKSSLGSDTLQVTESFK